MDAIFLDVSRANLGGMAVLKAMGRRCPMVIATAHPEHAATAFESEAVDYLLKPVNALRLERALKRIETRRGGAPRLREHFRLRGRGGARAVG